MHPTSFSCMNTFLSIYIPTFKRVQQLSTLLSLLDKEIDILLTGCSSKSCSLEVVISSSFPPDYDVIINLLQDLNHKNLFRAIAPQNIVSGSVNVVAGSSLCNGKYVWILCDDDIPKKGGLATLADILCSFAVPPTLLYLEPDFLLPDLDSGEYINENGYQSDYIYSAYSNSMVTQDVQGYAISEMSDEWLNGNVQDLLRASSIVFSRLETHHYWLSSVRDTYVTPLALALDAFRKGDSYIIKDKIYFYVEVCLNKKSWSDKWPIINHLESCPLVIDFLRYNNIHPNKRYFSLSRGEYRSLFISILRNPRYIFKMRSLRQVAKFVLSSLPFPFPR